jgi:hypothetical protein
MLCAESGENVGEKVFLFIIYKIYFMDKLCATRIKKKKTTSPLYQRMEWLWYRRAAAHIGASDHIRNALDVYREFGTYLD